MSELMKHEQFNIETIDHNMYSALKNSVYPGAKDESIAMVWAYCKARRLDPLQKPVHIVPMWIVDKETGKGEMRDVVMPGIGMYRIQAQRSGVYAGQSDSEFGEEITETLNGVTVTYPKWCRLSIKKMMPNGTIVEFPAKELWKENYANAGKDKATGKIKLEPNAMWLKRPFAQLAKCTEAQALRKAFPDIIDQGPTAEEMEGKHFDEHGEIPARRADALNKKLGLTIDAKPESTVNPETGEVSNSEMTPEKNEQTVKTEAPLPFSIEEIEARITKATSIPLLIEAVDLVNSLPSSLMDAKKALMNLYRQRQKELA